MLFCLITSTFLAMPRQSQGSTQGGALPILLYHRFGSVAADSMTVTTPVFESHLHYIKNHGLQVISLRQMVELYRRKSILPPRLVVLTADDGHRTIYTEAFPLLKKYQMHMTVFLYPSAISKAPYAMTWDQVRELKETGLFDFQSHTYWHPNFKEDRKKMPPVEFERSVWMQLKKSKATLEKRLGSDVDMLAWPFGIYDPWLMAKATEAGYLAAFTMDGKHVRQGDPVMALPRYLLNDGVRIKTLANLLAKSNGQEK